MKMIIEIPDNMVDMCKWHKDGICELTNIEIDILAEAVVTGTPFSKINNKAIRSLEAWGKVKEEIQEKINQEIYSDGTPSEYAYCYDSVLDIITKHLKEVEIENR